MLEVAEVTKVFKTGMFGRGELTAVSNVSFVVRPGEVTSLIGESGSGKTTVGRMILRLTGTTEGEIKFEGRDVASLGKRDLRRYFNDKSKAHREARYSEARIHRAGDKLFGTFRVTGIDHAGKPFDRYGIDLYELRDGKIALKDSYLKAE